MAIVRIIFWVVVGAVLAQFAIYNWQPIDVRIFGNLVLETKIGALIIIAFALGLTPMWLLHRATTWRLKRRIAGLEATIARPNTVAEIPVGPVPEPPPPV